MQSPNEKQADTAQVPPPLGRTPSESVRVRKEQQGAVQFCARLGRSPTETHELLGSAYQEDALRKTVTKTYHKRFENLGVDVYKSNTKTKKTKNTTNKKPTLDDKKSEENGGAKEAENGGAKEAENGGAKEAANEDQETMNVEQCTEETKTSSNGEGEHQPQPEPAPQEAKELVQNTTNEGSTEKVEGAAEA